MSLTQKEKDTIQESVENISSEERRNKLKGFVREYVVKNIIVHAILGSYIFGLLHLNQNYQISIFSGAFLIAIGIFWTYVCSLFYQSLRFFRNANKLATCFDPGTEEGINYINNSGLDK